MNVTKQWREISCDEYDEIKRIQNNYYWQEQFDGSIIVVLYALVCSFGALANLVVLFAFIRTANLRNLRNSFIVNLATSDLLLCVVTAPLNFYATANMFWSFGLVPCKIIASVQAVNTFVSSLTLTLIALDRVLLTIYPVRWKRAARAPLLFYGIVWFVSICVSLPYCFAVSLQPVSSFDPWDQRHTSAMLAVCGKSLPEICVETPETWERAYISKLQYTIIVLAIQYLVPLCALAFAYIRIGTTIHRRSKVSRAVDQTRRMSMQNRNRRALLLLLFLVLAYALCWAPVNIYNMLTNLNLVGHSQYRYLFFHLVGISSACINPLIYALVNENFRVAVRAMLMSFPLCYTTKRANALNYEKSQKNEIREGASTRFEETEAFGTTTM